MQATATTRRLQMHRVWLAITLAVLLGVLAAGVALAMTRDDAIPATVKARPVIESKTNDNFRFAEMNMLPEAAPAPALTIEQIRFREINMLPGDYAPLIAPFSDRPNERY